MPINYTIFILLSASLSFGLSIFHPGIYWDDFTFIDKPFSMYMQNWLECGRPQLGWLHYTLSSNILLYKFLIFSIHIATSFILFFFLKAFNFFKQSQLLFLVLLFNILPINQTRDSVVMVQYQLCVFLLFLSCFFFTKSLTGQRKKTYALLSFFLAIPSFTIEASASLYFVLVPITIAAHLYSKSELNANSLIQGLKKNILFLVLPVAYILLQLIFLKPYGGCAGNNALSLGNIALIPRGLLSAIYSSLFKSGVWPILQIRSLLLFIPGLIAAAFAFKLKKLWNLNESKNDNFSNSIYFFLIGVVILLAGILPYIMVGKQPSFHDWAGRYQAHAGLGLALIVLFVYQKLNLNKNLGKALILLTIFTYVTGNFAMRLMFYREYVRDREIVRQLKTLKGFGEDKIYKYESELHYARSLKRELRFYELTSLAAESLGKETTMVYESKSELDSLHNVLVEDYKHIYSLRDFNYNTGDKATKVLKAVKTDNYNLLNALSNLIFPNSPQNIKQRQAWFKLEILDK